MKTYLQIWVMVCLLEENMLPFVIIFSLTAKQIQDLAYFLVLCHFPDLIYSKKIPFKFQAFPEMPRQLQKNSLGTRMGAWGWNPRLGKVKN